MEDSQGKLLPRILVYHSLYERIKAPGNTVDRRRDQTLTEEAARHAVKQHHTSPPFRVETQDLQTPYVFDPFHNCMRWREPKPMDLYVTSVGSDANGSAGVLPVQRREGGLVAVQSTTSNVTDAATGCRCSLNLHNLFEVVAVDVPHPFPPLSRCELHEILRALPPRVQNRPWRLCYDTSRDGSSLRNFYRAMEHVYETGDAGLGIFLLAPRKPDTDLSPSHPAAREQATRASSPRQRPGDLGRLTAIVGCFTPKVPCLEAHGGSQHAFYGSPETFVFRLRLAGKRLSQDELTPYLQRRRASAAAHSINERADLSPPEGRASEAMRRGWHGTAESGSFAGGPTNDAHRLFIDEDESGLILPVATRRWRVDDAAKRECVADTTPSETAGDMSAATSRYAASPISQGPSDYPDPSTAGESAQNAFPSVPTEERDEKSNAAYPAHIPILEKFTWCGKPTKKQYVLAQNHFFAIGGGQDGAALHVDENLQYCTSSGHCETFDSPALFGGRPPPGLRHTEAVIARMMWFSIREGRDGATGSGNEKFRMMTLTKEEEESLAENEGQSLAEVSCCRCGRHSAAYEDAASANRLPTHRCNEGYFAF